MISFEQEVKKLLDQYKVPYNDYGESGDSPDLHIQLTTGAFYLELKEKRQTYNPGQWPLITHEHHSFIIDEFTVRKIMTKAPLVGVAIRDNTTGLYYFADVYTLVFSPHQRCNREMESIHGDEIVNIKGKWCLDMRFFPCFDNLKEMFITIKYYMTNLPTDPSNGVDCFNLYKIVSNIPVAGTKRSLESREHDVEKTR